MNHKHFISIDQVWERLDQIPSFRTNPEDAYAPGLERIEEACRRMGNPQRYYRSVHVAGTNGKGSLCTTLGAVYEQAGFKVGVYTSPHLITFKERIRVNGQMIPDQGLLEFFNRWEPELADLELSYFEWATCMGFWWFQKQGVDLALLETGLGGRLDATNVVVPELSVITSIDYDHTQILGSTLAEIAREKAGIIKEGIPVLAGRLRGEAMSVIRQVASEKGSRLYTLDSGAWQPLQQGKGPFAALRAVSNLNYKTLELADAAVYLLEELYGNASGIDSGLCKKALEAIDKQHRLPARFERLHSGYDWFFDGAHTPEAIDTLTGKVQREFPNQEAVLIFALMEDRAVPGVVNKFSEFSKKYYYELTLKRSAGYSAIAEILPDIHRFPSNRTARLALMQSLSTQLVIFGGSFYFYSVVREWMNDLGGNIN